jgi:hypothetical protein
MISAWWLILIVPVSYFMGYTTYALLAASSRADGYIYQKEKEKEIH